MFERFHTDAPVIAADGTACIGGIESLQDCQAKVSGRFPATISLVDQEHRSLSPCYRQWEVHAGWLGRLLLAFRYPCPGYFIFENQQIADA